MIYDYINLKAMSGKNVGMINGKDVYAIPREELSKADHRPYYIVYDDSCTFVSWNGKEWMNHGHIEKNGTLHKLNEPVSYMLEVEKEEKEEGEPIIGDVQLGLMVDEVLRKAREMRIEDLL